MPDIIGGPRREEPIEPGFNKQAFIESSERMMQEHLAQKKAWILERLRNSGVDLGKISEYLDDVSALERLKKYGDYVVDLMDYIGAGFPPKGRRFMSEYQFIGSEDEERMLDTLAEEFGITTGPLNDAFTRVDLFDLRAAAAYSKYAEQKDPIVLGKESLSREIARIYIASGKTVPSKIRLLLKDEEVQALENEERQRAIKDQERLGKILKNVNAGLARQGKTEEEALINQGTDPRFVQAAMQNREESIARSWENLGTSLGADFGRRDKEQEAFLSDFEDPREVVDILLGGL